MPKNVSTFCSALLCGGTVSLAVLDTTALVNEGMKRQGLSFSDAELFGKTLTAATYLCGWLKTESEIFVSLHDGKGGRVGVSGDGELHMRGYLDRTENSAKVGNGVGKTEVGTLTVVRNDGVGLPFSGTCELVSDNVAENFSAYFLTSEQRPTAIGLCMKTEGEKCLVSGGVFLQPLPGAEEGLFGECKAGLSRIGDLSERLRTEGTDGILRLLHAEKIGVREVKFQCRCSRERAASAILSLGKENALAAVRAEGTVTVTCPECKETYLFTEPDIQALFGK